MRYNHSTISFTAISNAKRLEIAKNALNALQRKVKNGESRLSKEDNIWLKDLNKYIGSKSFTMNNPDNLSEVITVDSRLTVDNLNKHENPVEILYNTLSAMVNATLYKPLKIKRGNVNLTVHDKQLAKYLKEDYSKEDLKRLRGYLNKNKVFNLPTDKNTGIINTCGSGASENFEMGARLWVTDTVRNAHLQKRRDPNNWKRALNSLAEFYAKEEKDYNAFSRIIRNPELYREGAPSDGVAHVFMPTLERDGGWNNNKRLESIGLAMKAFCENITDGIVYNKRWGFKSAADVSESMTNSIVNMSKYLESIRYWDAPSAGNWEEIPMKGGLTWDTESVREGFVSLKNLLFNPEYNKNAEVLKIRNRLKDAGSEQSLNNLIAQGENRIRKTYLAEAPGIREADASLVFLTQSDVKLSDNPLEDIMKHLEILDKLEKKLVRDNGMLRYEPFTMKLDNGTMAKSPDSYLNLNYFIAADKNGKVNLEWKKGMESYGSKDASEADVFFSRAEFSVPNHEAQWFLVSDMSAGYGKIFEKMVNLIGDKKPSQEQTKLLKFIKAKQTEYLNRAISRKSPKNPQAVNQIKANGLLVPSHALAEAHQWVSTLNSHGKPAMMQGTNAPLAWATSSSYNALNEMSKTVGLAQKLNI